MQNKNKSGFEPGKPEAVELGQWRQVLLSRLLFDRAIWDTEAWIQRQPEAQRRKEG